MPETFESRDCHVVRVGEAGDVAVAKRCTRPHVRCGAYVCNRASTSQAGTIYTFN
jgi:hypothetical protein